MPLAVDVSAVSDPEQVDRMLDQLTSLAAHSTHRVIQERVFHFSFVQATDNPVASEWLLVFFNVYGVLGFTASRECGARTKEG